MSERESFESMPGHEEITSEEKDKFIERASEFLEITEGVDLINIAKILDSKYPGVIKIEDIEESSVENLKAEIEKHKKARQLYKDIMTRHGLNA